MKSMYEAHLWLAGMVAVVVGMHVTLEVVQPRAKRPELPEPPVWVSLEADEQAKPVLAWQVSNANEVIVERRVGLGSWNELTSLKETTRYRDASVQRGESYSYRLRSRNRVGPSLDPSDERTLTIARIEVAIAPKKVDPPTVVKVDPPMPMPMVTKKVDPPMPMPMVTKKVDPPKTVPMMPKKVDPPKTPALVDVKARAVSPTEIEITWKKPEVAGAVVTIEKSNDSTNYTVKTKCEIDQNRYTEENLSEDYEYYYRLVVMVNDIKSDSTIVKVKTLPKPMSMEKLEGDVLILAIHTKESNTEALKDVLGKIENANDIRAKLVGKRAYVFQEGGIVPLGKCDPAKNQLDGTNAAQFLAIQEPIQKLLTPEWLKKPKSRVIIIWSTTIDPKFFVAAHLKEPLAALQERATVIVIGHRRGLDLIKDQTVYLEDLNARVLSTSIQKRLP